MINLNDTMHIVTQYLTSFPEEKQNLAELCQNLRMGTDLFSRKQALGHITCSGLVLGRDGTVLMIHHRVLDKWLLPGGHLESTDNSLQNAAMRELTEELGLSEDKISTSPHWPAGVTIDIDPHRIPENPSKAEPEHTHWDFRYVFEIRDSKFSIQIEEVFDAGWRPTTDLPDRLFRKVAKWISK